MFTLLRVTAELFRASKDSYELSQMDPRDALPHAHRAVHGGGRWL